MTPVFIAASLMRAPAATTEALVSSAPPSHAPATRSFMPVDFAIHGITIIIGTANIRTSDGTKDKFFLAACIAPHAADADATPPNHTAGERIAPTSSAT